MPRRPRPAASWICDFNSALFPRGRKCQNFWGNCLVLSRGLDRKVSTYGAASRAVGGLRLRFSGPSPGLQAPSKRSRPCSISPTTSISRRASSTNRRPLPIPTISCLLPLTPGPQRAALGGSVMSLLWRTSGKFEPIANESEMVWGYRIRTQISV